jgi:poly(3-hydroxyalkanoate) synthetase
LSRQAAAAATAASQRQGYLDGARLAEVFAWLRPNDLIWSYWVNNYLLGKEPKAFDILYWNADPVRMTAALHRDFVELAVTNSITEPGGATMLGSPVDLGKVDTDTYVVAGIADHLCKWESCYRTTQLLGGDTRFVLSTSGHIASMVNPPGNPRASFRIAEDNPADPQRWLESATTVDGSWWDDYTDWLAARTGPERNKPRRLGSAAFPPVCDAPGTYVHDR